MKKADVKIGERYMVKVSGKLVPVRIVQESIYGGWIGRNTVTGRDVRIKTAGRLRAPVGSPRFRMVDTEYETARERETE